MSNKLFYFDGNKSTSPEPDSLIYSSLFNNITMSTFVFRTLSYL